MPLLNRLASWWLGNESRSYGLTGGIARDVLSGGSRTDAGVRVNEQTALCFTAVYAAVRIIAETVAALPLPAYRELPGGGKDEDRAHPAAMLLGVEPNPEMSAFTFRETLQGHVLTWGNGYAEIEFDGRGRPVALWPIEPSRVNVERTKGDNRLVYDVANDVGANTTLERWQVFHVPGFGFDGLVGYSPIHLARNAIALGVAAESFGSRYFANDTKGGGHIELPGMLKTDEDIKRFRDSWQDQGTGSNQHKVKVLEQGAKFVTTSIPPNDAQFLETRKFQVSEVARMYRVPAHMLGDLERATFSNIEHQGQEFLTFTLQTWLSKWEQEASRKLVSTRDRGQVWVEFKVNGLLRGDIEARHRAYATGRQWGWLSADDVRSLENMNPLPDGSGKIYLSPSNMIPADKAGDVPAPGTATPAAAPAKPLKLARAWCDDAARQLVGHEAAEVRKALLSPDSFDTAVGAFYAKHIGRVRAKLGPLFAACGKPSETEGMARAWVQDARSELLAAANDAEGLQLRGNIEAILARWEAEKPAQVAARALGDDHEHRAA